MAPDAYRPVGTARHEDAGCREVHARDGTRMEIAHLRRARNGRG